MINKNKLTKVLSIAVFLCIPVFLSAQSARFITYFPIPFAYHSEISVKTLAILAGRGEPPLRYNPDLDDNPYLGYVEIGSQANPAGLLIKDPQFQNLNIIGVGTGETSDGYGLQKLFVGTLNESIDTSAGQLPTTGFFASHESITGSLAGARGVLANDLLSVKSLLWGANGGIGTGENAGFGSVNSCSSLEWTYFRIQGSNTFETYLECK